MSAEFEFREFVVQVRASPSTNDYEVRFLGDGQDLIARFWPRRIGVDPSDILEEPCGLDPTPIPHRTLVARCNCGVIGCGDVRVEVHVRGERVSWIESDRSIHFGRDCYVTELARAKQDLSWEPPDRIAARILRADVDHSALEKHALSFQGASGRIRPDSFTASLRLVPGPYQVLVTVPWRGESPDQIAASLADVLRQDPRAWDSVQYLPQEKGLPVPPIAGPGWRHWNWPGRSQGEASEPGG